VRDSRQDEYHGEELSSFVRRSSCCIRRLTVQYCEVDIVRDIIEVLTDVEELCVDEMFEELPGDFLDFVQGMIHSHDIHLPNLRVVQVPCCPGHFMELIPEAPFFNRESGSAPVGPNIAPLEKLIVTVNRNNCGCGQCGVFNKASTDIDYALKVMCHWPSFSVICLNYDQRNLILTLRALAAGTAVDLTIYYPSDPDEYEYYSEDSYKHYNILENKRLAVNT